MNYACAKLKFKSKMLMFIYMFLLRLRNAFSSYFFIIMLPNNL